MRLISPQRCGEKEIRGRWQKTKKERRKGTKILLLDQPYISSTPIDMSYNREPAEYNEGSQLDLRKTII